MTDNIIRVGSVLRRQRDGRRFRVLSMRKQKDATMPMHNDREFRLDDPDSQMAELDRLEKVVEALEAQLNDAIRKHAASVTVTTPPTPKDDEPDTFELHVDRVVKRDSVSRLVAMSRARHEVPEIFAKYNRPAMTDVNFEHRRANRASSQFEQEVARIASERRISKTAAASACRLERKDLFDALQRGDE